MPNNFQNSTHRDFEMPKPKRGNPAPRAAPAPFATDQHEMEEGFAMPSRAAVFSPQANERLNVARTRCAAIGHHLEWLIATDRRYILCMTATLTILVVMALTMYTLIVTSITQARIERAVGRAKRSSALPTPLNLQACPVAMKQLSAFDPNANGVIIDPNCYDSCKLGIIKCEDEENEDAKKDADAEKNGNETDDDENMIQYVDDDGNEIETDKPLGEPSDPEKRVQPKSDFDAIDTNGNLIPSRVVDKDGNITPHMRIMFNDLEDEDDDDDEEEDQGTNTRRLRFCICARSSASCACRTSKLKVKTQDPEGGILPLRPGHLVDITVGKAVKIESN